MRYYRLLVKDKYTRDCWVRNKIYKESFCPQPGGVDISYIVKNDPLGWLEVSDEEYLKQEGLNKNLEPISFFDTELSSTLEKIQSVLGSKAKEYSTSVDKFHNFNEGAKLLGCIPEKCLDAYMTKHIVSYKDMLTNLEKGIVPSNELIDEKLGDIINYFILQKIQLKQRNNVVLPR